MTEVDLAVIGAGLSGLRTAMLLQKIGFEVRVVEGRNRVGGRVFTLDHLSGHPEALCSCS